LVDDLVAKWPATEKGEMAEDAQHYRPAAVFRRGLKGAQAALDPQRLLNPRGLIDR
jgi:hypothetical protein